MERTELQPLGKRLGLPSDEPLTRRVIGTISSGIRTIPDRLDLPIRRNAERARGTEPSARTGRSDAKRFPVLVRVLGWFRSPRDPRVSLLRTRVDRCVARTPPPGEEVGSASGS